MRITNFLLESTDRSYPSPTTCHPTFPLTLPHTILATCHLQQIYVAHYVADYVVDKTPYIAYLSTTLIFTGMLGLI